jgi:hypothetical protein
MRIKLGLLVALAAGLFAPEARSQGIVGDVSRGYRDQQPYNRDVNRLNLDLRHNNWGGAFSDAARIGQDQRRLYYDQCVCPIGRGGIRRIR